ncbi:uncharacterized protein DS421_11g335930 [Arachis hypogaea]|nr:uncharacterized protein DS421_11g335930 [Arachis hypogaea]
MSRFIMGFSPTPSAINRGHLQPKSKARKAHYHHSKAQEIDKIGISFNCNFFLISISFSFSFCKAYIRHHFHICWGGRAPLASIRNTELSLFSFSFCFESWVEN